MSSITRIVHPTDYSEASIDAFAHALRIALLTKGHLDVVHIASGHDADGDLMPPQVRHTLALWGLAKESDTPTSVGERLNIKVTKIEMPHQSAKSGILSYLHDHPGDLLVVATHGREGLARWLRGSVAESIALRAETKTLFFPPGARSFVDEATGEILLTRVLVPVDHDPAPAASLKKVMDFLTLFDKPRLDVRLLHAGTNPPAIPSEYDGLGPVELRGGQAVDAILKEAGDWHADLIVMPTAGHQGFMDTIAGSTSERVLRHAPCPVLTVPVHA